MATNVLSLPIDIPWKRLAISHDMYADRIGNSFPEKWHTSLAVFSYEPPQDPLQQENDEVTTFLKIVASITGYNKVIRHAMFGILQYAGYKWAMEQYYYPALSALIQLAVYPNDENQWGGNFNKYPYISDFEPKKREIIEGATETGEYLTASNNGINTRKGNTTTDNTETFEKDNTLFVNANGQTYFSTPKATKSKEEIDILTSDKATNDRNTYSHSSQITQLYQVLDSYHVGTNRALFFVNARPHLKDSPYTFVQGPRRLEGIQEFFVIIRRPKEMTGICVKAKLETAHLDVYDDSGDPATMFITAREVSGCSDNANHQVINPAGPWTVYEQKLPDSINDLLSIAQGYGRDAQIAANKLSREIQTEMMRSFQSGIRYPMGQMELEHTDFFMKKILKLIQPEHIIGDRKAIRLLKEIRSTLSEKKQVLLTKDQIVKRKNFLQALSIQSIKDPIVSSKKRKR